MKNMVREHNSSAGYVRKGMWQTTDNNNNNNNNDCKCHPFEPP